MNFKNKFVVRRFRKRSTCGVYSANNADQRDLANVRTFWKERRTSNRLTSKSRRTCVQRPSQPNLRFKIHATNANPSRSPVEMMSIYSFLTIALSKLRSIKKGKIVEFFSLPILIGKDNDIIQYDIS
ncbi:hypothetical protein ACTXT7_003829 [Hymenolepis weldensis]